MKSAPASAYSYQKEKRDFTKQARNFYSISKGLTRLTIKKLFACCFLRMLERINRKKRLSLSFQ
jgi:hypothetical protein